MPIKLEDGSTVVQDRINRKTRTRIQILDQKDALKEFIWRWAVVCIDHGNKIEEDSRWAAGDSAVNPDSFCPECRETVKGV